MTQRPKNEIFCFFATTEALEEAAKESDARAEALEKARRRDALTDAEATVGPGFWGAFEYYIKGERYGATAGRATRKEYCGFVVSEILLGNLIKLSAFLALCGIGIAAQAPPAIPRCCYYSIEFFWTVWVFMPRLAVFVRRLHDLGISGKRIIAPSILFLVGYGVFIMGVGFEAWSEDVWTWKTLNSVALVGVVLTTIGALWSARYGLAAFFCRGEAGPNRFGGERLNPTRERLRQEMVASRKSSLCGQTDNSSKATVGDTCVSEIAFITPAVNANTAMIAQLPETKAASTGDWETPIIPNWGEALGVCFSKFFTISGRASRPEFWYFILTRFLIVAVLLVLMRTSSNWATSATQAGAIVAACKIIRWGIDAIWLIPSLTCAVRRLQDSGRSGANIYWGVIPVLGWIILLFQLSEKSEEGPNRFGAQPVKR